MKNILLAVTGASPQVVTETLFGIHKNNQAFPDEIYLITTKSTKDVLINGLIKDGYLKALLDEYALPNIKFDESHVLLMEDKNGNLIEDAKTVEDQSSMADFITRTVYQFTQQPNTAIHASIAGGRKTMAYYLGYAMSLFGREQDTLSHVFVNDEFEFVPDFWYPTQESKMIAGKKTQTSLDTSKAVVTLAEIPFVKMRNFVKPAFIQAMQNNTFTQTIDLINTLGKEDLAIVIDKKTSCIKAESIEIKLTNREMAFYLWLLKKGKAGIEVDRDFDEDPQHGYDFLRIYIQFKTDKRVFDTFKTSIEDIRAEKKTNVIGMKKDFIQTLISTINNKIKKKTSIGTKQDFSIKGAGNKRDARYFIDAAVTVQ